jgi:hypothetical protein
VLPKIGTSARSGVEYLQRLSIVFASELRLKIVTELYLREMSPKQFYDEFGGGSLSRVDKNFKKLAEHGWLRYIRSETGGRRRGAREHFYRATALAVFDNETWALVPYSMRVAINWRIVRQIGERVRQALEAKTLDAHSASHMSCPTVVLDQAGWERTVAAVDELFHAVFEEQDDAKLRIPHTGEEPTMAIVGLSAFESPARAQRAGDRRAAPPLVQVEKESPIPFTLRVSKVFADSLCLKIVAEANLREISAPMFHAEFGGDSVEGIRRRFKKTEAAGWLKQVSEKTGGRRRSAVELFYRATGPVISGEESWLALPPSVEPTQSWTNFKRFTEKVREAIDAETLESRPDAHLSWALLALDRQGWANVTAAIDALIALIDRECEAAKARIARSDGKAITATIGLAAFEYPKNAVKEP